MRNKLAFFCVLLGPLSIAISGPLLQVRGTLAGFDADTISIKQNEKTKIILPRNSVPSLRGYISGSAQIVAYVDPADLLRLNPNIGVSKSK